VTTPVPWHDFSSDPRRPENAVLRASDTDRAVVVAALGDAYADGRLTKEEYDERADAATAAKTLGELPPLLADLVPLDGRRSGTELDAATKEDIEARAVRHWERQRTEAFNGFVFITVVTWVIWWVSSGGNAFPWPVFPMLFVGMRIPQVLLGKRDIVERERAKLAKKELKALRAGEPDDEPGDEHRGPESGPGTGH
jgi:hypothetical protein